VGADNDGAHRSSVRSRSPDPRADQCGACQTAPVLVIRGTKKVLDRLGGVTAAADRSTTRLGDWYVSIPFWRPQVGLFVSETGGCFRSWVPFAPAATLIDRFPNALLAQLQAHEVPRSFTEAESVEMETRRLAKTASRSVLGGDERVQVPGRGRRQA
jgi:Domain of unknown function (DUF6933)